MGQLTIATIFIVIVNLLMWWSQAAMIDINPAGSICYTFTGSIIDNSVTSSGNLSVVDADVLSDLPSAEQGSVQQGTTNVFTDSFRSVIGWFKSAPGIKYAYGVIAAPYNILKCTGLPPMFIAGLGTLWYLSSFLVLLAFILGGRP